MESPEKPDSLTKPMIILLGKIPLNIFSIVKDEIPDGIEKAFVSLRMMKYFAGESFRAEIIPT